MLINYILIGEQCDRTISSFMCVLLCCIMLCFVSVCVCIWEYLFGDVVVVTLALGSALTAILHPSLHSVVRLVGLSVAWECSCRRDSKVHPIQSHLSPRSYLHSRICIAIVSVSLLSSICSASSLLPRLNNNMFSCCYCLRDLHSCANVFCRPHLSCCCRPKATFDLHALELHCNAGVNFAMQCNICKRVVL